MSKSEIITQTDSLKGRFLGACHVKITELFSELKSTVELFSCCSITLLQLCSAVLRERALPTEFQSQCSTINRGRNDVNCYPPLFMALLSSQLIKLASILGSYSCLIYIHYKRVLLAIHKINSKHYFNSKIVG